MYRYQENRKNYEIEKEVVNIQIFNFKHCKNYY